MGRRHGGQDPPGHCAGGLGRVEYDLQNADAGEDSIGPSAIDGAVRAGPQRLSLALRRAGDEGRQGQLEGGVGLLDILERAAALGRPEHEDLAKVRAEPAARAGHGRVSDGGTELGYQRRAAHSGVLKLPPGVLMDGCRADEQVDPHLVGGPGKSTSFCSMRSTAATSVPEPVIRLATAKPSRPDGQVDARNGTGVRPDQRGVEFPAEVLRQQQPSRGVSAVERALSPAS